MYKKTIIIGLILITIGGIILAIKEIVKGHCGISKCTYDVYTKEKIDKTLTGKILNDIDLSEVLTPGIYVLGDNVTDTKNEGNIGMPLKYVILEVSSNREIADDFDQLSKTVYQRIMIGSDLYSREIYVNEDWTESFIVFDWKAIGQRAVITGTLEIPSGESGTYVDIQKSDLPEGFTPLNSVVVSKTYTLTDSEHPSWSYNNKLVVYYSETALGDEYMRIAVTDLATASGIPIRYKVVLMRID